MKHFLLPVGVALSILVMFVPFFVQQYSLNLQWNDEVLFDELSSMPPIAAPKASGGRSKALSASLVKGIESLTFAPEDVLASSVWVIQLEPLASETEANALVAALRAEGFNAFMGLKGESWVVSVGPTVGQEQAHALAGRLAAAGHEGVYQHYRPVEKHRKGE